MAKRRKLDDISVEEVSIVDKAANKRRFMFIKRDENGEEIELLKADTDITIKSDGTSGGTTVTINGRKIARIHEASFAFYDNPDSTEGDSNPVYFRYVTSAAGRSSGGFRQSKTFVLSKADGIEKIEQPATDEDLAVIGAFVGEEVDVESIDGDKAASIAKSLGVAEDYLDVAPAEFRGAIKELVQAVLPSSQDETGIEKVDEKKEEKEVADEKKDEERLDTQPKGEEIESLTNPVEERTEPKEEPVKSPEIDLDALADKVAEKMLAAQAEKDKVKEDEKTKAPEVTEPAEEDQSDNDDDTVDISPADLANMVVAAVNGEGVSDENDKD